MPRQAVKRPFEYGLGEKPEHQRANWPRHQTFTESDSAVERAAVRAAAAFVRTIHRRLGSDGLNISQAEAARRAGLSAQTVSAVLRGDVWPDLRTAASLAHVLGIPLIVQGQAADMSAPATGGSGSTVRGPAGRSLSRPAPGHLRCRDCDRDLQPKRRSSLRRPVRSFHDEELLRAIVTRHHGSLLSVSVGDCIVADRLMELVAHRAVREGM